MNYQTSCHNSGFYVVTKNARKEKRRRKRHFCIEGSLTYSVLLNVYRRAGRAICRNAFCRGLKGRHALHRPRGERERELNAACINTAVSEPRCSLPPAAPAPPVKHTCAHRHACTPTPAKQAVFNFFDRVISQINHFTWWQTQMLLSIIPRDFFLSSFRKKKIQEQKEKKRRKETDSQYDRGQTQGLG